MDSETQLGWLEIALPHNSSVGGNTIKALVYEAYKVGLRNKQIQIAEWAKENAHPGVYGDSVGDHIPLDDFLAKLEEMRG